MYRIDPHTKTVNVENQDAIHTFDSARSWVTKVAGIRAGPQNRPFENGRALFLSIKVVQFEFLSWGGYCLAIEVKGDSCGRPIPRSL